MGNHILLKIVSEYRLSGKNHFYTIADSLYYYKKMDADSDGFLTRGEMLEACKRWGMSEEVSEKYSKDFSDTGVDFAEFREWMAVKITEEDFIRDDFNAMDINGDGFLSAEELHKFNTRVGATERVPWSNLLIRVWDTYQDGLITFEEYAAGMYGFVFMEKAVGQSTVDMFQAYDWNMDRKVAAAEIKATMEVFYVEWSEEDILLFFDQDGDGELDLEEFHQYNEYGDSLYYYKKMDADSDGFLTRGEMLEACNRWFMSEKVSEKYAEDFTDAGVDFAEFREWMAVKVKEEDFIRDDFNALDIDRDGYIVAFEFYVFNARVFATERVTWSNMLIMLMDKEQDGLLTFEEYAAGMYGYSA